jgi:riboflavin synthase
VFTGLVQALGTIEPLADGKSHIRCLAEGSDFILQDLAIGDSVAVDGVCLTVEEIGGNGFVAAVSPETLHRSTLGQRQQGNRYVNLEASLRVGSKLGGHFVTGHVDGIGCLQGVSRVGNSWEMQFTSPSTMIDRWQQNISPYLAPKGSIAVNGISLTIAQCDRSGTEFSVAVIPHTYQATNLHDLEPGSWVNLEGDILGKYVERILRHRLHWDAPETGSVLENITPDFLAEHGYL